MAPERFSKLLEQYLQNRISAAELRQLLDAAREEGNQQLLKKALDRKLEHPGMYVNAESSKLNEMYDRMLLKAAAKPQPNRYVQLLRTGWWRYAAALVLLIAGAGTYFFAVQQKPIPVAVVPGKTAEVVPGKDGAILTLADGSNRVLDSLRNGVITTQNGSVVSMKDGWLVYHSNHAARGTALYNTLITPRGRQFRLLLEDGTRIWLNAASSIRFPARFTGKERQVELSGEAFLEVARNTRRPFSVMTHYAEVQVLGTVFNVSAYRDDHKVKATLLEGKIRLVIPQRRAAKKELILHPGEQVTITDPDKQQIVKNRDTEEAIAWKNGLFQMKDADLPAIMRQVARWYDIQVVFAGPVPEGRISGEVPRTMQLQKLLDVVKASGIDAGFRWEGRTLVITNDTLSTTHKK